MFSDNFQEVEHWLRFIEQWEKENTEDIPDKALDSLDYLNALIEIDGYEEDEVLCIVMNTINSYFIRI